MRSADTPTGRKRSAIWFATVFNIPIFGQLANTIADAGFAVLRYDKRGVGQSGGRPEAVTLADYSDDQRAAVKYLTTHKDVNGKRIAYVELGGGELVFLFLHGNPTSSYLWRNVMPEVAGFGRCVAPDLIGMGDSDKIEHPGPDTYRFTTHRDFLWGVIEAAIDRGDVCRDVGMIDLGHGGQEGAEDRNADA